MATKYELIFINNSTRVGDVCIFQEYADTKDPNIHTLAWLTKRTNPQVTDKFQWTTAPCFVWSETGVLVPGVTFESSQVVEAGLEKDNNITFTKEDGAFQFKDLTTDPNTGALTIICDQTIPQNQASVGIGMSGAGTLVAQAQPNMNYRFETKSNYKITFGNFIQGQVIDPSLLYLVGSINFPANVYSMTATLNPDNTWTIAPTI
ncbi:hypothetical protein [uncultured Kordia sp.]|uniref:hypothetical protein n=1 Tax=uncultured Kordia sp. TaxID=507699 RepID=UPI002619EC8C|nr:hypothetical protein [uncultured Kordia sp.]